MITLQIFLFSGLLAHVYCYLLLIVLVSLTWLGLRKRRRLELIPEFVHTEWQHEGLRAKAIVALLGKLFLHLHEVLSESVLVCNDLNAGALRYALVWLDAVQDIGSDRQVEPADVKVLELRSSALLVR